jgi:hypothetical protein
MSLLSFRASVQCAACHRCGNALGKGVRECPHCGALQTAVAIRTHSAIDFPNGVPARMTQRMLVPYPSVPEEVETATNIARQRAQAIRRVLFGVTTSALCAGALVLAVGPSLRAPAGDQRIAALPQRNAAVPEEGPTVTADAALPSHAPGTPGPADTATAVLSVPPPPVAAEFAAAPAATSSSAPTLADVPAAKHTATPEPAPSLAAVPAPAAPARTAIASTLAAVPTPATTSKPVAAPSPTAALASVPTTKRTSTPAAAPLPALTLAATPPPAAIPKTAAATSSAATLAAVTPPAAKSTPAAAPLPAAALVATLPAARAPEAKSTSAASPSPALALAAIPAPVPLATPTQAVVEEPKAAYEADDNLYAARLALIANDLSATRVHLSKVAPTKPVDPEAQRIADELARRESVRDADMQRARACDAANLWPCARRYAKAAMAIDTSYPDSQVFYKRVVYKQAAARKAAEALMQALATPRQAPIRDATPLVHYVSHGNPVPAPIVAAAPLPAPAPVPVPPPAPAPIAPRSFPIVSARPALAESHDLREVREVREPHILQEVRPAEPPAPAPAPAPVAEATDYAVPIMARGRGVAH